MLIYKLQEHIYYEVVYYSKPNQHDYCSQKLHVFEQLETLIQNSNSQNLNEINNK